MISSAPYTGHFLLALFDGHGRLLSRAPKQKAATSLRPQKDVELSLHALMASANGAGLGDCIDDLYSPGHRPLFAGTV